MYKIGVLTPNIKEDIHSAELFEQACLRAEAVIIQPKDLQLEITRGIPVICNDSLNVYDLDALVIRRLDQSGDTDLQFDLLIQLEQAGVLLVNSTSSVLVSESKALTSHLLSLYGFPVIDGLITQDAQKAFEFASHFEDVVVKPLYGQLGQGLYRLSEVANKRAALENEIKNQGSVYIQRFVQAGGRDIRAFVIDDRATAAIQRQATNGWKSNVFLGGKAQKITLDKQSRDMAVKACQIIGLDYCGVDIIYENGRPYILELNGSPAWQGVKETTGKNIAAEIISVIIRKLDTLRKSNQYIAS